MMLENSNKYYKLYCLKENFSPYFFIPRSICKFAKFLEFLLLKVDMHTYVCGLFSYLADRTSTDGLLRFDIMRCYSYMRGRRVEGKRTSTAT